MTFEELKSSVVLLFEDVAEAENRLDADSTQFNRRTYIRTGFAAFEGTVWILKQLCLTTHHYLVEVHNHNHPKRLTAPELAIAEEISYFLKDGKPSAVPSFIKPKDNFRFAIDLTGRLFDLNISVDTSSSCWRDMKTFIEIRNRITHPKRDSLTVTDNEIDLCGEVAEWFNDYFGKIIISIGQRVAAAESR